MPDTVAARSSVARTLGSRVRIPLKTWTFGVCMHLFCVCVVLYFRRAYHSSKVSYNLRKMITGLNKRPGPWMGWKSHWKEINLWMPEPIFMKLGILVYSRIMAPEPVSMAYIVHLSHQSVCLYLYPPTVARQRLGRNFTAAPNTQATLVELDVSFSMQSVSYKRKAGDSLFPELPVYVWNSRVQFFRVYTSSFD
jgi:hypothetical protein